MPRKQVSSTAVGAVGAAQTSAQAPRKRTRSSSEDESPDGISGGSVLVSDRSNGAKCRALENQLEIANAALAKSAERETTLRRMVTSLSIQIRTLRAGEKKASTGRPRKLGARGKLPFAASLRGIAPDQWSPQLLSMVRFLHGGLVEGEIDLRSSDELRQCLGVDRRVWKDVVETTGAIEKKPRKMSPQQLQHETIIEALNSILPTLPDHRPGPERA